MTLIALTLNNFQERGRGYPVMLADILVSTSNLKEGIPTPTFIHGTTQIYGDESGRKPFALMQKLYVINERLCVALAGSPDQMTTLLKRLNAIYGDNDFDDDDLLKYIEAYPPDESNRLAAIILKAKKITDDEHDFAVRCIGNVRHIEKSIFGDVVATGSGADDFLKLIQSNPFVKTDITNTDAFLAANESMIGHFLGYEISTGITLKSLWGAGFEMIVFERGKFAKVKEYTVVVMKGQFGRNIKFEASPFSTMMINYQDDVLLITTFTNDVERVFAVPTILDERDRIEVIPRELEHGALLLTYILTDVDTNTEFIPALAYPRNLNERGKTPVVIERLNGGVLRVHKDGRQDDAVVQLIQSRLKQNGR